MSTVSNPRCAASRRTGRFSVANKTAGLVRRCPASCCVAIVALLLHAMHALGVELSSLELSAGGLAAGKWWTIVSGHLLHLSVTHLLFCVAGLLVVGYVFEPLFGRAYVIIAGVVVVVVALVFVVAHPDLSGYYGLSALDQGLFVAGLVALWRRGEQRVAALMLGLLAAKWTFELLAATSLLATFALDEALYGVAVPWTHVAGGVTGLLAGAVATASVPGRGGAGGNRSVYPQRVT